MAIDFEAFPELSPTSVEWENVFSPSDKFISRGSYSPNEVGWMCGWTV
jgi:hypothetical protein